MPYNSDEEDIPSHAITDLWGPLVASLTELADESPAYIAGTLDVPTSAFDLYYKDANDSPRAINLVSASAEELNALMQACQPASFGRGGEDVLDESYRKAGKLDASAFSTPLVPERTELSRIVRDFLFEGEHNKLDVVMELYKLNIYGKDSFFKEHVDTPRNGNMMGSLVIVFPTLHRGGELVLRWETQDAYTFDSGTLLTPGQTHIAYAAFYSDVAHEVLPVTDGHRVTLTFNLYSEDSNPMLPVPSTTSARMTQCKNNLEWLLQDGGFLPDGGLLVFGLRHAYPVTSDHTISSTYKMLKGADRVLFNMLKNMGLSPDMHLWYDVTFGYSQRSQILDPRALVGYSVDLDGLEDSQYAEHAIKQQNTLRKENIGLNDVAWVTPVSGLTKIEQAYQAYGNEHSTEWVYAYLCLIARVKSYATRNDLTTNASSDSGEGSDAGDGMDE